jgi:hypothetical protein
MPIDLPPVPVLAAPVATATFAAVEQRRLPARDAEQGVAASGDDLYAISNHSITRIAVKTGKEVARWEGDAASFPHLNSCIVSGTELLCAASNYPAVPMHSRIERFDARSLRHLGTQPLDGPGSLTWVVSHDGGWWACYANYDGNGGTPGRDHTFTTLVRYDRDWHATAEWRFPQAVLDRMSPRSASGGIWGKGDLLYVTGHDRPELYALRAPAGGGTLTLVATISIPTDGQAIALGGRDPNLLWSIERRTHELVASRLPVLPADAPHGR